MVSLMNHNLEKIVIVGGGTAGWMTAACLSRALKNTPCKIVLIESPTIATVGVGEATIPPILDFLRFLGIDERDFIQNTQATFKLGIQFQDWRKLNHTYWHQFGSVGTNIDGLTFYQQWLKTQRNGGLSSFTDYSPAIAMAKENKFIIVPDNDQSILSGSKYALHLDATLVARYLSQYAQRNAVQHISASVEQVTLNEKGFIDAVTLQNGDKIQGDFFIDCTGFSGLLIEGALHAGYEDWNNFLPCDSAVVVQTTTVKTTAAQTKNNNTVIPPYTRSRAQESGWQWQIPLQHRTGNGYVFCSQYSSDEHAEQLFKKNLEGQLLTDPRFLRFKTGKRKKMWDKNCLAVGLSSGFLEPLESTSIHLIMKAVTKFVTMLPNKNCDEATSNEFNRILNAEYESIRDFIVLHYCTSERNDSDFWRHCSTMNIPDSLQIKLELFKSQGRLYKNEFDLFSENSWYAVLEGMGVRPRGYDPLIGLSHDDEVKTILQSGLVSLTATVKKLPSHSEFIQQNCSASNTDQT